MLIKEKIRSTINILGFDISRQPRTTIEMKWLKELNIRKVVDIGANEGQFAYGIHKIMPKAEFFVFEPIPAVFGKLRKNLTHTIRNIHFLNIGLGDYDGELAFELNEFTPSSSFRKIEKIHVDNYPKTAITKNITVKIDRLDNYIQIVKPDTQTLIKMDVQGYEDKVIEGGETFIRQCKVLIVELSFVELYEGSPLFHDIYQRLHVLGFQLRGTVKNIYSTIDGSILQCDGIFIKP